MAEDVKTLVKVRVLATVFLIQLVLTEDWLDFAQRVYVRTGNF